MDVRLVIVAPTPSRKAFKVRLPVVVGRGEEAKVRLAHDSVSRRHCEFTAADGDVYVTDLGSTNGTGVGGGKVEPHAVTAVSNGGHVRIGGVVLRLEYAAAGARAAAASADDTGPPPPAAAPLDGETLAPPASAETDQAAESALPAAESASPAPDFAALAGAEPAPAAADGSFEFLGGEAEAPPAADDKLDDFFKSLS